MTWPSLSHRRKVVMLQIREFRSRVLQTTVWGVNRSWHVKMENGLENHQTAWVILKTTFLYESCNYSYLKICCFSYSIVFNCRVPTLNEVPSFHYHYISRNIVVNVTVNWSPILLWNSCQITWKKLYLVMYKSSFTSFCRSFILC